METATSSTHTCSEEKLATLSSGFAFLHGLFLGSGGNLWKRPQAPRMHAPKESSQRSRKGLLFFTVFLGARRHFMWQAPFSVWHLFQSRTKCSFLRTCYKLSDVLCVHGLLVCFEIRYLMNLIHPFQFRLQLQKRRLSGDLPD